MYLNPDRFRMARRFEELVAWQRAKELTLDIYRTTGNSRFSRDSALRNQIRRAAVSIMSNLAEGFERYSRPEFKQFISVARGSAAEVRSQLMLAYELGYLAEPEFRSMYDLAYDISRMLAKLRTTLDRHRP